ncbi:MAG: DUF3833 domain-containing protein [Thalassovita sp.]
MGEFLMILTAILLIALAVALRPGMRFSSQRAGDYAQTGPAFDLRTHLNGPIQSEGVIHGPTGRVSSRFVAQMHGEWNGATGTLTENFSFAGGRKQTREWSLKLANDGTFTATAPDVIGTATGEVSGAAICMRYRIRLQPDAGGHILSVTDWLYLMENGVILNRSEMRKFGIKVAELTATMRPVLA